MSYSIRNADERDLDALVKLECTCFSLPWTRGQLRCELPDERHEFLVAQGENGEILGYCAMMTVLDEGDISNVAVAPEVRRQGIGRALVEEMLRLARLRALSFVTLEVREHNEGAIALYSQAGFVPVGRRRGYYEQPREDALLMTITFDKDEET